MFAQSHTIQVTVRSHCCHLKEDTEVSAAVPPVYRAASSLTAVRSLNSYLSTINCTLLCSSSRELNENFLFLPCKNDSTFFFNPES